MSEGAAAAPPETGSAAAPRAAPALWSRGYRRLVFLAGVVGVVISLVSWAYLEFIAAASRWIYEDLPGSLGFSSPPWWWPLPWLLIGGLLIAVAIARLPGRGGHEPWRGLSATSPTRPAELPGVALASLATLCFGLVLGPEAPLIALGSGLTLFALGQSRREIPDEAAAILAGAGAFAAISTIFGSPVIGAVIIIEAVAVGGPRLPVLLLPGLTAAGIGSVVFLGIGNLTGLSTSEYALTPIHLPAYATPTAGAFAWTVVLAGAAALVTFAIVQLGRWVHNPVNRRPFVAVPVAAMAVGAAAIAFAEITGQPAVAVLFSGQEALDPVYGEATALSLGTLALLLGAKGFAWGVSLGAARGGPTFPAIFLGLVGGLMAAHLPGISETPAVAVLIGAACVSVLRLPLSSVVIALLVTQAGSGATPLVIVGVVVAYIASTWLSERFAPPPDAPDTVPAA